MAIPNPNPNIADGVKSDVTTYSSNKIESLISSSQLPVIGEGDEGKVVAAGSDGYELESLADVATTGDYSDLSGTPTLATVATSGSYNDLTDKPDILKAINITIGELSVEIPVGTMRDIFYNTDVSASLPEGAALKGISVRYITPTAVISKQYCNDGTHISVSAGNLTSSNITVTAVDVTLFYI